MWAFEVVVLLTSPYAPLLKPTDVLTISLHVNTDLSWNTSELAKMVVCDIRSGRISLVAKSSHTGLLIHKRIVLHQNAAVSCTYCINASDVSTVIYDLPFPTILPLICLLTISASNYVVIIGLTHIDAHPAKGNLTPKINKTLEVLNTIGTRYDVVLGQPQ